MSKVNLKKLSDHSIKELADVLATEAKSRKLKTIKPPTKPKPDKKTLKRTDQEVKDIVDPLYKKYLKYKKLINFSTKSKIKVELNLYCHIEQSYNQRYYPVYDLSTPKLLSSIKNNPDYIKVTNSLKKASQLKKEIKKEFSNYCKKLGVYQYVILNHAHLIYPLKKSKKTKIQLHRSSNNYVNLFHILSR